MAENEKNPVRAWLSVTKHRQLAAAGAAFVLVLILAFLRKWPFHQPPVDLGENPSIFEILLNERVTLGLLRAGLAAVVTYAVVSVPALIFGGRWMKGLGTTGVTVDEADNADQGIEDLQEALEGTEQELEDQLRRYDLLAQLYLQEQAEKADNGEKKGGA